MKKIRMVVMLVIAVTGILASALATNPLVTDFRIPSVGIITINVLAESGSVEHIQAAVDRAIRVGAINVTIPEGNFPFSASGSFRVNFNVPAQGLNIFGAGTDRTLLDMPDEDTTPQTTMFRINGLNGGRIRISGITFKGRNASGSETGDIAVQFVSCKDFRIDHCSFYYMGGAGVSAQDHDTQYGIVGGDPNRVSQGVVDHCYFYDIYKAGATQAGTGYGYGVAISRAMNYLWTPWDDNLWNLLGKYDKNVFIEDCYFWHCRHAVTGNFGAVYVLRNSIIEDITGSGNAQITGHPVRKDAYGMRAWEIYNNTFRWTGIGAKPWGIHMEGGSGVVYNNTIQNTYYVYQFGSCEYSGNPFYPKGNLADMYVWNNIESGYVARIYWIDNTGVGGDPAPVENVNYFLRAPLGSEGNYTPYIYPHPLTLG